MIHTASINSADVRELHSHEGYISIPRPAAEPQTSAWARQCGGHAPVGIASTEQLDRLMAEYQGKLVLQVADGLQIADVDAATQAEYAAVVGWSVFTEVSDVKA
ncbi:hypothetical protein [Quatrionicoccus australiensis]|uniref:hypothetical protein n=1 Tax=Quatrionicoccus australiensis TaxID=138118 RepID=UPI001CFBD0BA|nr:hypothetical protein [Quatrionicoccus australiensis]MCB4359597.1 hypothetical protein [Quatrionicoccus australiensis]